MQLFSLLPYQQSGEYVPKEEILEALAKEEQNASNVAASRQINLKLLSVAKEQHWHLE